MSEEINVVVIKNSGILILEWEEEQMQEKACKDKEVRFLKVMLLLIHV